MANLIVVCGPQAVGKMTVAEEKEYLLELERLFTSNGGNYYFVELSADIETRLVRNETPHRMERKVSKRDVEWSKSDLLRVAQKHKLNTDKDEYWFDNHIKIDNSKLEPDEVADMVIEKFQLVANEKIEREYRYGV